MTEPEPEPLTTEEEKLLDRSARLLAAEDPQAFIDVSARVRSTVRSTTRRSRPVHAVYPSDPSGAGRDALVVREWVVVGHLREVVAAVPDVVPTRIRLTLEEDRCAGVRVHVTATYGAILADMAGTVRARVRDALADLLGESALEGAGLPVDVVVDDVVS